MRVPRRCWLLCSSVLAAGGGCSAPEGSGQAAPGAERARAEEALQQTELASSARPVRVRFRARVGDAAFACDRSYALADGSWLTPADLRFFVHDVRFTAADGTEQSLVLDTRAPWQLADVALLDLEDGSGACTAGTPELNVELTGSLPPGTYVGLSFANGVPEALNHADPAAQPPPLQPGSMHWGWLFGYRFLMAEVYGESDPGGAPTGSALFHLGSTGCSGAPAAGIRCSKPNRNRVRLDGFDPELDEIVVDVLRLFEGVDLNAVTTCHSGGGQECAPFLERVGVNAADGSASAEQNLFRVEPAREEP